MQEEKVKEYVRELYRVYVGHAPDPATFRFYHIAIAT
jgi:hypothetical protein